MPPLLNVLSFFVLCKVSMSIVIVSSKMYFRELSSTKQELGHFNYKLTCPFNSTVI